MKREQLGPNALVVLLACAWIYTQSTQSASATQSSNPDGPQHCYVYTSGASTSCLPPSIYSYTFHFDAHGCSPSGNGTITLEAAPTGGGPWTALDQHNFSHSFNLGPNTIKGTFDLPTIPPENSWYRIVLTARLSSGQSLYSSTLPALVCEGGTPIAISHTPTSTVAPIPTTTACVGGRGPDCRATPTHTPTDTPTLVMTPSITPTSLPDLTGELSWSYQPCPYPVLRLRSQNSLTQACQPSVMRLTNSNGEYRDFAVPDWYWYDVECQIGTCVPSTWLAAQPYTLTVDYLDAVRERNESNNTATLSQPAPQPTACANVTGTPTPLPTYTATLTGTRPPNPNMTGELFWAGSCPGPTLRMQARMDHVLSCYGVSASIMRLSNRSGAFLDFPVPALRSYSVYERDCQIGTCLPESWLTSLPLTLTVDYTNAVYEHDETDNDSYLSEPAEPCGTRTPTATTTGTPSTPTFTPTATPTARCPGERFPDVCPGDFFYTAVMFLSYHNVISGYADGTFRPFNNTTRGQLCKIVVLAEGWEIINPPIATFADVPVTDPFYAYVETAYYRGVISGYSDGTFRPYNSVTRGQLSKIVVVAEEWPLLNPSTPNFSDVVPGSAFYRHVETAFDRGVISGYADGTFRPGNNATRGQICKIVYSALQLP